MDDKKFPVGIETFDEIISKGYLTILSYDPTFKIYSLRIPNREVEQGLFRNLCRHVVRLHRGAHRP